MSDSNNPHITLIEDYYRADIPRKTILAWSALLAWQNNNDKPLRKDLELHASVEAGTFGPYIDELCEQQIIDTPQSCRLRNDNGSFDRVCELVENDIGPFARLPFNGFRFKPNSRVAMEAVWVKGGCQILIETWGKIPNIRHEIKDDWKVTDKNSTGATITFSTQPDKPEIMFYFTPKPHPADRSEVVTLFTSKGEILQEQQAGLRSGSGVIALAGALSFGTGMFEGNVKCLMFGPITLMMIVHCFRQHPKHSETLYNALIDFLHPIKGQREGIVRGAGLILQLKRSIGDKS
jgi:hypothetical protein